MTPSEPLPQDPPAPAHHEEARGAYPTGTVAVVGFLVIMIGAFWMLVLGVLQGRA